MKFFINQQLPEAISEHRRETRQIIRDQKEKEKAIPTASKSTFTVRNDKLFINGQLKRKKVTPPMVQELFLQEREQKEIDKIKIRHFHTTPEAGSQFKVGILKANSFDMVNNAYIKLFQKHPAADQISVACQIDGQGEFHDNGEFGAGYRILRCITQANADNIAVFMVRYFGGTHLGPRRFTILHDMVTQAIDKVLSSPEHSGKNRPTPNVRPKTASVSSTTSLRERQVSTSSSSTTNSQVNEEVFEAETNEADEEADK